jgi:hypothetical protein
MPAVNGPMLVRTKILVMFAIITIQRMTIIIARKDGTFFFFNNSKNGSNIKAIMTAIKNGSKISCSVFNAKNVTPRIKSIAAIFRTLLSFIRIV